MNLLYRRIRKSEITLLKEFCFSKNIEEAPFKHHNSWLKTVLNEIEAGNVTRVAFGAFFPTINEGIVNYQIIGCLFLKRSNFDNSAELKSLLTINADSLKLLIDENHTLLNNEYDKNSIKLNLVEKAMRFCEIRDFSKIEMELLQDEMKSEVSLLLDLGFRILYSKEKYVTGKYVSVLEKQIGDIYMSDPFDDEKILRWLIQAILPNKLIGNITTNRNEELDSLITRAKFNKFPSSSALKNLIEKEKHDYFNIQGEIIIIKKDEKTELTSKQVHKSLGFDQKSNLKYIICDELTKKSKDICKQYNIQTIDYKLIKDFAGGDNSSLQVPFEVDEVGGIITVLEKEEILNYAKKSNDISYFLVSGIGNAIVKCDDVPIIMAIYCYHWNGLNDGIIGYANIIAVADSNFENAYDVFPDCDPALKYDDLKFYSPNNESENKLKVLRINNFKIFEKIISLKELDSLLDNKYISNELNKNLASSVYINTTIVDFLLRQSLTLNSNNKSEIINKKKIMFSFSQKDVKNKLFLFLKNKLTESGHHVIIDSEKIGPGDSIVDFSKREDIDCGISFFSSYSIKSPWFGSELNNFLLLKKKNRNFRFIPISFEEELVKQVNENKNFPEEILLFYIDQLNNIKTTDFGINQKKERFQDSISGFEKFFDYVNGGNISFQHINNKNKEIILKQLIESL